MLCGRVLQRGRGAEVQRSRGVVFPVCAVVVSAFMQRAEGCCGCFCIFAENKEIHGVCCYPIFDSLFLCFEKVFQK